MYSANKVKTEKFGLAQQQVLKDIEVLKDTAARYNYDQQSLNDSCFCIKCLQWVEEQWKKLLIQQSMAYNFSWKNYEKFFLQIYYNL